MLFKVIQSFYNEMRKIEKNFKSIKKFSLKEILIFEVSLNYVKCKYICLVLFYLYALIMFNFQVFYIKLNMAS